MVMHDESALGRNLAPGRPPATGLSIAAAICAAIPCCPLTSLAGIALGIAALGRIRRSGGALGGRRLALFALIAGALSVLLQIWILEWGSSTFRQSTAAQLNRSVDALFLAAQRGDHVAFLAQWAVATDPPSEAVVKEFGAETLRRYGSYRSFTPVLSAPAQGSGGGSIELAVTFSFDQRDLTGSIRYALVPNMGAFMPMPRITEVVIDDDAGQLVLGGARPPG